MIASHPRIYGRYQEQIKLDHYLELLLQKSRALGNTKVYKPQMLAPVYEQYRRSLNARSPRGNREFVKILMLHRDYPTALVTEAIEIAMAYNVYSYDGVFNILDSYWSQAVLRRLLSAKTSFRHPRGCCNTS